MAIKISEYTQELTTFDTPETIKQEVSMETSPSVWETKWYSWTTLKNFFSLKNVLLIGNETDGTNIKVNDADAIELENTSTLKKGTYDFGADGGISRICGVGYEDMWQAGIHHVFDSNGLIRESNNCFDIVPNGSFDNTLRFKVGSRWILDDGTVYVCSDASTGAAVWAIDPNTILYEFISQPDFASLVTANKLIAGKWYYVSSVLNHPIMGNLDILCQASGASEIDTSNSIALGTGVPKVSIQTSAASINSSGILYNGTLTLTNTQITAIGVSGNPMLTKGMQVLIGTNNNIVSRIITPNIAFPNIFEVQLDNVFDTITSEFGTYNPATSTFTANPSGGTGDVVGPASSVDNNIATFDGTTGKLIQDGGTTIADINTNAVDRVTVKLSQSINKGQAVYISSANGTNIIVSKADNTSESTSSKTIGLLETSGAINAIVNVVTSGLLDGLDTSTATIGDPVWLGTSGNLIYGLASKPFAPAHLVYIGVVSRVHATVGEILIKVQNGFELKEIHDVDVLSVAPANKDVLQYESSSSLWKNKALTDTFTLTSYNGSWTAPADSTTYYLPLTGGIAVPLTTITTFLNTFTFGIKIFGILVQNIGSVVNGTGENVTIGIRNNTDGVNSSLINIQTNQASGVAKNFEDYSLNVDIPANKAIAVYITTPAWVTNPTNVIIRITLFIQKA